MPLRRSSRALWRPSDLLPAIAGLFGGAAIVLNHFAELPAILYTGRRVIASAALSAILGALLLVASHRWILQRLARSGLFGSAQPASFARFQSATYLPFMLFGLGATGFRLPDAVFAGSVLALFAAGNAVLLLAALPAPRPGAPSSPLPLALLFFVSGIAALVYQVTWQRALFACFGVNIESATLVVTIFMFGLGAGGIAGGLLSRRAESRTLIKGFLSCELAIGAFGLVSLPLIREVGGLTVLSSLPVTALVIFGLLSVPTLLMGATLPLLVTYAHRQFTNVGRSVGLLYFVNTIGSALACYLTADLLFVVGGERAATVVAAGLNFAVVIAVGRIIRQMPLGQAPAGTADGQGPATSAAGQVSTTSAARQVSPKSNDEPLRISEPESAL